MIVSLLFLESSKRVQKLHTFLAMSKVTRQLVTNYFFCVNERRKGMD